MLVAMKPNAPNPLNQFDRATVNRPPNAGAVSCLSYMAPGACVRRLVSSNLTRTRPSTSP
jgi:hypothetical protein